MSATPVEIVWTLLTGVFLVTHLRNMRAALRRFRYQSRLSPRGENGRRALLARGRTRAEVFRSLSQALLFTLGVLALLRPGGGGFNLFANILLAVVVLTGVNSVMDRAVDDRIERMTIEMERPVSGP